METDLWKMLILILFSCTIRYHVVCGTFYCQLLERFVQVHSADLVANPQSELFYRIFLAASSDVNRLLAF